MRATNVSVAAHAPQLRQHRVGDEASRDTRAAPIADLVVPKPVRLQECLMNASRGVRNSWLAMSAL